MVVKVRQSPSVLTEVIKYIHTRFDDSDDDFINEYYLSDDYWVDYYMGRDYMEPMSYNNNSDNNLLSTLNQFPPEVLIDAFNVILNETKNDGMITLIFYLSSRVLYGDIKTEFYCKNWEKYSNDYFFTLTHYAYKCLSLDEAKNKVMETLDKKLLDENWADKNLYHISLLKTSRTLDLIEKNVPSIVDFQWGVYAARSEFDWPRAKK